MRTPFKILLTTAAVTLAAAPLPARAQNDINPPLPNVLLLVDTSGSMEYLIQPDPLTGKSRLPGAVPGSECLPGKTPTILNRWATLISVLTGQINNFTCQATPRDSTFSAEYGILGEPLYDLGYFLPFHRLASNGCTPGPGSLPTNWYDWPTDAIHYHSITDPKTACTNWSQADNGILDVFRDRVRFGMMTFDTFANPGTGVTGNNINAATGEKGLWSYYHNWFPGPGSPAQGKLPKCAQDAFEVGARNPGAPPWEGRLIPFGPGDASLLDVETTNDHIQDALNTMRPYGATPLAGMFDDAKELITEDVTNDPSTGKPYSPALDPFVQGGCRKTYIILLSDGEPNMDLRTECSASDGKCPYQTADTIAADLAALPGSQQVLTYVVGFGVSNPAALTPLGLKSCSQLDPAVHCKSPSAELKACCELTKIASAGLTSHAYFADDQSGLQSLLSNILAGISSGSTARTVPVFGGVASTGGQGNAGAAGYRFIAQFKAAAGTQLWSGLLDRERYVCAPQPGGGFSSSLQTSVASSGDDFAANLNTNNPTRKFFTFPTPELPTGQTRSDFSLRPNIKGDDGLGTYGSGTTGMSLQDGPTYATTLAATPKVLGIDPVAPGATCTGVLKSSDGATCVERLVRWNVGENNAALPDTRNATSCQVSGGCSALGSIYHSTPALLGPPQDTIRDDTYVDFAVKNAKRPIMLYTATTDGQLHAFKVAAGDTSDPLKVDSQSNNELWSFMPPVVLPRLIGAYNQQGFLTDGPPVTADVVYERRRGAIAQWSSVLVAGGGTAGGFYYAVDITDPLNPRFLWQLSTDGDPTHPYPLFGRTTPRPAITTVTVPDGSDFKEVAVAILSGGTNLPPNKGPCPPRDNSVSIMHGNQITRTQVRCWSNSPGASGPTGRSLTIVRLDTGEILMNFRGNLNDGPPGLLSSGKNNTQVVAFTSPLTGIPAPFPAGTGKVADRIYVGDADGALWRVDLSSGTPQSWKVNLAWDAYSISGDTDQTGEPVQTAPVIATTAVGDTAILFSTGDQELLSPSTTMITRLWSLVETRNVVANTFEINPSFSKTFTGGERVTGPMALFASVLYFSSFAPASLTSACDFGGSAVWALDYQSAAGRFPDPKNPGTFKLFESAPNTIIFGVGITQTPTCADKNCAADDFFGVNCSATNVAGGGYEINWQKGPGSGVTSNTLVKTGSDGVQSLGITSPRQSTRIDSWAGIIE